MNQMNSVYVYIASSIMIDEVYFSTAWQLGQLLCKTVCPVH
jgi:hypothetical protein